MSLGQPSRCRAGAQSRAVAYGAARGWHGPDAAQTIRYGVARCSGLTKSRLSPDVRYCRKVHWLLEQPNRKIEAGRTVLAFVISVGRGSRIADDGRRTEVLAS